MTNTIIDFWRHVGKRDKLACWEWTGEKDTNGYGRFNIQGKTIGAHRYIYELIHGKTNLYVCHKCDNPSCVNPEHLFAGTQAENIQDCVKKGRHKSHKKRKLTNLEVRFMRAVWEAFPGKYSQRELAKQYNMSTTCIWKMLHRKSYRDIQ